MTRNNADFQTRSVPMSELKDVYAEDLHPLHTMTAEDLDSRWHERSDKPYPWDELHDSIQKEGIKTPLHINIDAEGYKDLIEGHHRYIVARNLGLTHVPVRFTND